MLDMLSGEEAEPEGDADGSYSSRMSNKSEKNMADFDGEDSACEEELAQLAVQVRIENLSCFLILSQYWPNYATLIVLFLLLFKNRFLHFKFQAQINSHLSLAHQSPEKSPSQLDPRLSACFKIDNVCQPGNTLLWDLLQDNKIGQLGEGLALEAEKALCNLLCYNTDRIIRMKFIEGCLHNLANNW